MGILVSVTGDGQNLSDKYPEEMGVCQAWQRQQELLCWTSLRFEKRKVKQLDWEVHSFFKHVCDLEEK